MIFGWNVCVAAGTNDSRMLKILRNRYNGGSAIRFLSSNKRGRNVSIRPRLSPPGSVSAASAHQSPTTHDCKPAACKSESDYRVDIASNVYGSSRVNGGEIHTSIGTSVGKRGARRNSTVKNLNNLHKFLLFTAASRLATEKNTATVNINTGNRSLTRSVLQHGVSVDMVTDDDLEKLKNTLQGKSLTQAELTTVKCELNDQLHAQAVEINRSRCVKMLATVYKRFDKCNYAVQSAMLSCKLPLALPIIHSFFDFRQRKIQESVDAEPGFNISLFDSEKFTGLISLILQEALRRDPRKLYVNWANKTLDRHNLQPSTELILFTMLLMNECTNEKQRQHSLQTFYNKWASVLIGNVDKLHAIHSLSPQQKLLLQNKILPSLCNMPINLTTPAAHDPTLCRSILGNDRLVAESSTSSAPQLNLSDVISYRQLVDSNFHRQVLREKQLAIHIGSISNTSTSDSLLLPPPSMSFHTEAESPPTFSEVDVVVDGWRYYFHRDIEAHKMKSVRSNSPIMLLQLINTEELTDRLIDYALSVASTGVPVYSTNVIAEIGEFLFNTFNCNYLRANGHLEALNQLYPRFLLYFYNTNLSQRYTPREYWLELYSSIPGGVPVHAFPESWPFQVYSDLGQFLLDLILKHCQIQLSSIQSKSPAVAAATDKSSKMLPCFYSSHRASLNSSKTSIMISPHNFFTRFLRTRSQNNLNMLSNKLPMLVPPVPWCSQYHGGNIINSSCFMRQPFGDSQKISTGQLSNKIYSNHPDMNSLFDAVYAASSVPWAINSKLFDIVIKLYNEGGDAKLQIPQSNERFLRENGGYISGKPRPRTLMKAEREMHSLRMTALYQLSVANSLLGEKAFWFPTNMDYRGRCYDIPPVFNHIQGDANRSLLQFAQGRPLGDNGLKWLKLQLASLSGQCKRMSYQERLRFIDSRLHLILDSAEKPLDGVGWWKNCDEPFQSLAMCNELRSAMSCADPRDFVSHMPIHQDGSCNGLQHYAALGRDTTGAEQVNLLPRDRPQDIYETVAQLVEKQRKLDSKSDDTKTLAEQLDGFVNRKVVKQTVMTMVYGVTQRGAVYQVKRQLKDSCLNEKLHNVSSHYLSKSIFSAIGNLFSTTQKVQFWLTDLARLLSSAGVYTEWITPLGLPVVQPYAKRAVDSSQIIDSPLTQFNPTLYPDADKQRRASSPNFIHSLDASHMLLTSFSCFRKGVSFVSVHDCFWTHAASVEIMNGVCRDQFVRLHSECNLRLFADHIAVNVLHKVKNEQKREQLYRHIQALPAHGDFDIKQLTESTYFFS